MPLTKHLLLTLLIAVGLYTAIYLTHSLFAWEWLVFWPTEVSDGVMVAIMFYYIGCALLAGYIRYHREQYKEHKNARRTRN